MEALWSEGGWLTAAEVHAIVGRRRGLAYTTVMTVLVRLYDKGSLERQRRGRAFAYHPVQTSGEYGADRMQQILAASGNRSGVLTSFVADLSAGERALLRRLLASRR